MIMRSPSKMSGAKTSLLCWEQQKYRIVMKTINPYEFSRLQYDISGLCDGKETFLKRTEDSRSASVWLLSATSERYILLQCDAKLNF